MEIHCYAAHLLHTRRYQDMSEKNFRACEEVHQVEVSVAEGRWVGQNSERTPQGMNA